MADATSPRKRRRSPSAERHPEHAWLVSKLAFWFSSPNLRRSAFLTAIILADDNPDGWVPVSSLLTFNTLLDARVGSAHVLAAAADAPGLVAEAGPAGRVRPVGRAAAVRAACGESAAAIDARTVVLGPLPRDVSRIEVLDALGKGDVAYVGLAKGRGGCDAFVEFGGVEGAAALVAEVPPRALRKFSRLTAVGKAEWRVGKGGRANEEEGGQGKSWRERRGKTAAASAGEAAGDGEISVCSEGARVGSAGAPGGIEYTPGVVVCAAGYVVPTTQRALREMFEAVGGPVAYVDFLTSAPEQCFCRFRRAESAGRAVEGAVAPLVLQVLDGDAERAYWAKVQARSREKRGRKRRRRGPELL